LSDYEDDEKCRRSSLDATCEADWTNVEAIAKLHATSGYPEKAETEDPPAAIDEVNADGVSDRKGTEGSLLEDLDEVW